MVNPEGLGMGVIKSEVLKIKDDIAKAKTKVERYRVQLIWSLYSGGALLLLVLWWIIFPPEQIFWSIISHSCFALLIISMSISYWIINKIKAYQLCLYGLRIKLQQLVWEKICDCVEPCDCQAKMERAMEEEARNWSNGIFAEVKHEL